jgi:hypothetical protein
VQSKEKISEFWEGNNNAGGVRFHLRPWPVTPVTRTACLLGDQVDVAIQLHTADPMNWRTNSRNLDISDSLLIAYER